MRHLLVSLGFLATVASTQAATFVVTNTSDSGAGSLRSAIAQANASSTTAPNTVTFAPSVTGTILLTSGQIQISGPISINGPGADVLTVNGNANGRIFSVYVTAPSCPTLDNNGADFTASISGLTLTNAYRETSAAGGAIYSQHSLSLDSVIVSNSIAASGAGVYFDVQYPNQALSITNSQITNNIAKPLSALPGTHWGAGVAFMEKCGSEPTTSPVSLRISNSVLTGNSMQPVGLSAVGAALGVWSLADVAISDSQISNNTITAPNPAVPGKIFFGGAFYGSPNTLVITRSEVSNNTIIDTSGANATNGGGINVYNSDPSRQTNTSYTAVNINDSTISGNFSPMGPGGISAYGNVVLGLVNSTVTNNNSNTGVAGIVLGTGPTSPATASNALELFEFSMSSSILAGNGNMDFWADSKYPETFNFNSVYSLIGNICNTCAITINGFGNIMSQSPQLGALTYNGGPTRTQAPLPGSPVLSVGNSSPSSGFVNDQRGAGFARSVGGLTDIGAYQTQAVVPGMYLAAAGSNGNGKISPSSQQVASGSTAAFTVAPNAGYAIASVAGCGGTLAGNTYTTAAVSANCSVVASFVQLANPITTYSYSSGSYSNSGATIFPYTASPCFSNSSVQASCANYSGSMNITANFTVSAPFPPNYKGNVSYDSTSVPQLIGFNFSDGLNAVFANGGYKFYIETDGSGNIINGSSIIFGSIWQPNAYQSYYDLISPTYNGSSVAQNAFKCTAVDPSTGSCAVNSYGPDANSSGITENATGVWTISQGQPLQFTSYFNILEHDQGSILQPAGDYIIYGANIYPTNGTSMVATQGSTSQIVYYNNFPGAPTEYSNSIPYNSAFNGAWTLTATNLNAPNSPMSIATHSLPPNSPAGYQPPFIGSVLTSDLSLTPTFSWTPSNSNFVAAPGTFLYTRLHIRNVSQSGNPIIYNTNLASNVTSFTVPAGVLSLGSNYLVDVDNQIASMADATNPIFQGEGFGSTIESTRSYFNFSPSAQTQQFSGPVALPNSDTSGNFTFNFTLPAAGQPLILDPPVAVGYTYKTGSGNPNFASVTLPNLGAFTYTVSILSGTNYVTYASNVQALQQVTFPAGGVSSFQVSGIPVSAGLIPSDVTAFETLVTFVSTGQFTGTITPLTVTPTSQTISFGAAPSVSVNTSGTLSATASSGLPVTFSSQTTSTCTVLGSTVTGAAPGTCTVAADQTGNSTYAPATEVTQTFTVTTGMGVASIPTLGEWALLSLSALLGLLALMPLRRRASLGSLA